MILQLKSKAKILNSVYNLIFSWWGKLGHPSLTFPTQKVSQILPKFGPHQFNDIPNIMIIWLISALISHLWLFNYHMITWERTMPLITQKLYNVESSFFSELLGMCTFDRYKKKPCLKLFHGFNYSSVCNITCFTSKS